MTLYRRTGPELVECTPEEETSLRATRLIKSADGIDVVCEPAEEAALRAEWVANEAAQRRAICARAIMDEALRRVRLVMPGARDLADLGMMIELWRSLSAAARQPTATMQRLVGIHTAATTAIQSLAALSDAEISAYDPAVGPQWPA